MYFWLPVVIAEWEVEKWRSGEVGKGSISPL